MGFAMLEFDPKNVSREDRRHTICVFLASSAVLLSMVLLVVACGCKKKNKQKKKPSTSNQRRRRENDGTPTVHAYHPSYKTLPILDSFAPSVIQKCAQKEGPVTTLDETVGYMEPHTPRTVVPHLIGAPLAREKDKKINLRLPDAAQCLPGDNLKQRDTEKEREEQRERNRNWLKERKRMIADYKALCAKMDGNAQNPVQNPDPPVQVHSPKPGQELVKAHQADGTPKKLSFATGLLPTRTATGLDGRMQPEPFPMRAHPERRGGQQVFVQARQYQPSPVRRGGENKPYVVDASSVHFGVMPGPAVIPIHSVRKARGAPSPQQRQRQKMQKAERRQYQKKDAKNYKKRRNSS